MKPQNLQFRFEPARNPTKVGERWILRNGEWAYQPFPLATRRERRKWVHKFRVNLPLQEEVAATSTCGLWGRWLMQVVDNKCSEPVSRNRCPSYWSGLDKVAQVSLLLSRTSSNCNKTLGIGDLHAT